MQSKTFSCIKCGAEIISNSNPILVCEYCGSELRVGSKEEITNYLKNQDIKQKKELKKKSFLRDFETYKGSTSYQKLKEKYYGNINAIHGKGPSRKFYSFSKIIPTKKVCNVLSLFPTVPLTATFIIFLSFERENLPEAIKNNLLIYSIAAVILYFFVIYLASLLLSKWVISVERKRRKKYGKNFFKKILRSVYQQIANK